MAGGFQDLSNSIKMKIKTHPLQLFSEWFHKEMTLTKVQIPSAVCLFTNGIDGFPNARFVSFKELRNDAFVITGPLNSRKGIEIESNAKVALTFWWTETERQIRIQGVATKISEQLADNYFNERDAYSQAVSLICEQGKEIDNLELLEKQVAEKIVEKTKITRPENWGGYDITPIRIEFMEFKKNRFHDRKLYVKENNTWILRQIQP